MKYATAYDEKKMARALGVALPISMKKTVELCSFIRGKELPKAVSLLEGALAERIAIPFRRYAKGGTGHKPGMGPGRYPKKACLEVIKLLRQAQANAKNKGLDTTNLVVSSILAKKAAQAWHFGRQRGRRMKRCHVEVTVIESEKKAAQATQAPKKAEPNKGRVGKAKRPAAVAIADETKAKSTEIESETK
ncbi:50S ribosomal protein L22 [Candidatus Woesearchaeota archaeon]|nr:50S ribosomal protein L22 [Candidatus Woesearchaeota archaeon]